MDETLHKLGGGDIGVVVVLALYALLRQRDCLLRAVLQAAEALDAVRAEARLSVYKSDVPLRAELFALAAAYACVGDGEFLRLTGGELRPYPALKRVESHLRGSFFAPVAAQDGLDELLCHALTALLRHCGSYGRQHELMREQPDARALMRKTRPQVELKALVYLVQAAAEVAGVLADREGVRARGDFDAVKVALDVARQTAAVAGDDEADALGV